MVRLAGGRDVVAHLAGVDVVLLDLGLPDVDGLDVCRALRDAGDVPVIVVSARGEVEDRILGLHSGADDYLVDPYDAGELVARIHAVRRRRRPPSPHAVPGPVRRWARVVSTSPAAWSPSTGPVALSRKEFAVLALLADAAARSAPATGWSPRSGAGAGHSTGNAFACFALTCVIE